MLKRKLYAAVLFSLVTCLNIFGDDDFHPNSTYSQYRDGQVDERTRSLRLITSDFTVGSNKVKLDFGRIFQLTGYTGLYPLDSQWGFNLPYIEVKYNSEKKKSETFYYNENGSSTNFSESYIEKIDAGYYKKGDSYVYKSVSGIHTVFNDNGLIYKFSSSGRITEISNGYDGSIKISFTYITDSSGRVSLHKITDMSGNVYQFSWSYKNSQKSQVLEDGEYLESVFVFYNTNGDIDNIPAMRAYKHRVIDSSAGMIAGRSQLERYTKVYKNVYGQSVDLETVTYTNTAGSFKVSYPYGKMVEYSHNGAKVGSVITYYKDSVNSIDEVKEVQVFTSDLEASATSLHESFFTNYLKDDIGRYKISRVNTYNGWPVDSANLISGKEIWYHSKLRDAVITVDVDGVGGIPLVPGGSVGGTTTEIQQADEFVGVVYTNTFNKRNDGSSSSVEIDNTTTVHTYTELHQGIPESKINSRQVLLDKEKDLYFKPRTVTVYTASKGTHKGLENRSRISKTEYTYDFWGSVLAENVKTGDEQHGLTTEYTYLNYKDKAYESYGSEFFNVQDTLILDSYIPDALAKKEIVLKNGFNTLGTNQVKFTARLVPEPASVIGPVYSTEFTKGLVEVSHLKPVMVRSIDHENGEAVREKHYSYTQGLDTAAVTEKGVLSENDVLTRESVNYYSSAGLLIEKKSPVGSTYYSYFKYEEDANGNPLPGIKPENKLKKNRLKQKIQPVVSGNSTQYLITEYDYDDQGRVSLEKKFWGRNSSSELSPDGRIAYTYTPFESDTGVSELQPYVETYKYDPQDRVNVVLRDGIAVKKYYYDDLNFTRTIVDAEGNITFKQYTPDYRLIEESQYIPKTEAAKTVHNVISSVNTVLKSRVYNVYHSTFYTVPNYIFTLTDSSKNLYRVIEQELDHRGRVVNKYVYPEYEIYSELSPGYNISNDGVAKKSRVLYSTISYNDFNNSVKTIYHNKDIHNEAFTPYQEVLKNWKNETVQILESVKYISGSFSERATSYTYNGFGNQTSLILDSTFKDKNGNIQNPDALNYTYTYTYNALGERTATLYPDGSSEKTIYAADGQIDSTFDRKGNKRVYTYDSLGRVVLERVYAAGNLYSPETTFSTTFGIWGNPVEVKKVGTADDPSRVVSHYRNVYNAQGYLTDEFKSLGGALGSNQADSIEYVTTYTHDKIGRRTQSHIKDKSGAIIKTLEYKSLYTGEDGIIRSRVNSDDITLSEYIISESGVYNSLNYHNNTFSMNYSQHDSFGRAKRYRATIEEADPVNPGSTITRNIINLEYNYDYNGNVLSQVETINGQVLKQRTFIDGEFIEAGEIGYGEKVVNKTYSYDGLERLMSEKTYDSSVQIELGFNASESHVLFYSYDNLNNRTKKEQYDYGTNVYDSLGYYYSYDDRMLLSGFSSASGEYADFYYDENGSRTEKSAGETTQYTYDALNRIISISNYPQTFSESYEYDHRGHRISKKVGDKITYYVYDGNSIVLKEEYSASALSKRTVNVVHKGKNVAKFVTENGVESLEYHLFDSLGSRKVTLDSTGTVITNNGKEERNSYSSFGEKLSGSDENYNYTGKELDASTGLTYFNARYYDSEVGRFVTMDPAKDGYNWYVYCSNNPLRYVDPTGLTDIDWLKVGIGTGKLVLSIAEVGIGINSGNPFLMIDGSMRFFSALEDIAEGISGDEGKDMPRNAGALVGATVDLINGEYSHYADEKGPWERGLGLVGDVVTIVQAGNAIKGSVDTLKEGASILGNATKVRAGYDLLKNTYELFDSVNNIKNEFSIEESEDEELLTQSRYIHGHDQLESM